MPVRCITTSSSLKLTQLRVANICICCLEKLRERVGLQLGLLSTPVINGFFGSLEVTHSSVDASILHG